jgi:Leucine-rich repeat (LRR) protein
MKKLLKPVVYLLVFALLYGAYTLFRTPVINAFSRRAAEQAHETGDFARAAALYARVLDNSPRDEALRLLTSELYRKAGNLSRAEYILFIGLRDVGPSAALYEKLCAIYVEQDKLFDAVELLDNILSFDAQSRIMAVRPSPPVFLLPGGVYEEHVEAGLAAGESCVIYVSWTGSIPSVSTDLYTGPVALGLGTTAVRAVAVNADGLVSGWADSEYTLRNVVDPVVFTDPEMERVIRRSIGKPGGLVLTSDLWDIAELLVPEPADYQTLDDLIYLPRLQTLSLTGNGSRCDISVLPKLENLSRLTLTTLAIDAFDLDIIGQCYNLEYLNLTDNRIGSAEPLEGLERLVELDLSKNNLLDVTPLSRFGSLRSLKLTQNAIQQLSALSNLVNLEVLEVNENLVNSLRGLESLSRLEILDVSYNPWLTSIHEVSSLTSLKELKAAHCRLEALPDLSKLKSLDTLHIFNNSIPNLDGAAGLPSLRDLDCNTNAISSLEPLRGCGALEILDVSGNAVSSVEPLGGLPNLALLRIEHNNVKTLLPLRTCPKLRDIYAFGNSLTDPLNAFNGTPLEGRVRR